MEPFDLKTLLQFKNRNEDSKVDQIVIDSRRIASKNALFIALKGKSSDGHDFAYTALEQGAKYAIVNKNFPHNNPSIEQKLIRVDDPLKTLQEIAMLHRKKMKAEVLAITGSVGKTMLKDLLFSILSKYKKTYASPESFNSQIGAALSILQITSEHEIAIIEAGISELGEMERLSSFIMPDHVIVTNFLQSRHYLLQNEHLVIEKLKLLTKKTPSSWNLIPYTDHTKSLSSDSYKILFWNDLPSVVKGNKKLFSICLENMTHDIEIPCDRIYVQDLLQIALKASFLFSVPKNDILRALQSYVPEPMRTEVYESQDGVLFINDSYAQDPISIDIALNQFDTLRTVTNGKKIFVFDNLRYQNAPSKKDLERIGYAIKKYQIDQVVFSNKETHDVFKNACNASCTLSYSRSFEDAILHVKKCSASKDTVLIKGEKKHHIEDLIELIEDAPLNNHIVINLASIQSNIETLRRHLKEQTRICVMVKALAYGTDDVRIGRFLQSCDIDIMGVSYVDEGVSLKKQGIMASIFVLNVAKEEIYKAVLWDLEIGVHDYVTISSLQTEAEKQNKKIKVHLHLDTGMGRFGCRFEDVLNLAKQIASSSNLIFDGFMTHLVCADDHKKDSITQKQITLFKSAIKLLESEGYEPKWKHIANSYGALRFSIPECNMVRIGLGAYGLVPTQSSMIFQPAVSLFSKIVGINECKKGETIGYGGSYVVKRKRAKIAVLPIGYYDGLHRNYAKKGYVMIHGKKAPIVGNICMDYTMVDITFIADAAIGDTVLLFGEDEKGQYISPSELAKLGGSIVHELMTCLGPRIRRIFIYDESLRPR